MRLDHPSIRLARLTTSENELQHGAKESGWRVFNSVSLMPKTDGSIGSIIPEGSKDLVAIVLCGG